MTKEMVLEKLKAAIILLKGSLPDPKYSFEVYELNTSPISYYKCMLINIARDICDKWYERDKRCSSTDCSSWDPVACKKCANYRKQGD